jgi:DNA-binding CsgD family transcriptional regulator
MLPTKPHSFSVVAAKGDIDTPTQPVNLENVFALLEFAGQAAILLDPDGHPIRATGAAREILGDCEYEVQRALKQWFLEQSSRPAFVPSIHGIIHVPRDADASVRVVVGRIHEGAQGVLLLGIVSLVARRAPSRSCHVFDRLSERERKVASLIGEGLNYAEIAQLLGISVHTVRRHSESIFRKFGVHSRVRLVIELRR